MIAHIAEAPDLICMYYVKLREAYDMEGKDPTSWSKQAKLSKLFNHVETQLNKTKYQAGDELSPADLMFVHILTHVTFQDLDEKCISSRPSHPGYLGH